MMKKYSNKFAFKTKTYGMETIGSALKRLATVSPGEFSHVYKKGGIFG
jgi:hypothetical protein